MQLVFIIGVVVIALILAYVRYLKEKKRREGMAALAAKLGLEYRDEKDRSYDNRYHFLDALQKGSNQYAFNIMSGSFKGYPVEIFDYHYETHSRDSKGKRRTHHHYFSYFILKLEKKFPELKISREGILSKIAQAVGYDDINFESHEFSKKFCVRSKDKKFAYDVCHVRMNEYLLQNDDLSIEIESDSLALAFSNRLNFDQIERNANRLIEIRALMPDYIYS